MNEGVWKRLIEGQVAQKVPTSHYEGKYWTVWRLLHLGSCECSDETTGTYLQIIPRVNAICSGPGQPGRAFSVGCIRDAVRRHPPAAS